MTILVTVVEELARRYPGASISTQPDGTSIVHLPSISIPPGWNKPSTELWFILPAAYPAAQPDSFYAENELRLANGELPKNANIQQLSGIDRLWFSWHLAGWNPNRDSVLTFARFATARLSDAS
jgi:E2/UBC family protein E